MNGYDSQDLFFTEDGDLAVDDNGDLRLASQNELIEQVVRIVTKTVNPDWFYETKANQASSSEQDFDIGADMEDFLGMANTRDTAELGKEKIRGALVRSRFFEDSDIFITATPANQSTILFAVFIRTPFANVPMAFRVDLSLGSGVQIRRVK